MELSGEDLKTLEVLEEGLWRSDVRLDPQRMDLILAPDFFEFGRSGRVYRRADILAVPAQPIDARLPLREFHARLLDSDVVQVTYVSVVTYEGVEEIAKRSSIWTRNAHGWQLRFHQGTAVPT